MFYNIFYILHSTFHVSHLHSVSHIPCCIFQLSTSRNSCLTFPLSFFLLCRIFSHILTFLLQPYTNIFIPHITFYISYSTRMLSNKTHRFISHVSNFGVHKYLTKLICRHLQKFLSCNVNIHKCSSLLHLWIMFV